MRFFFCFFLFFLNILIIKAQNYEVIYKIVEVKKIEYGNDLSLKEINSRKQDLEELKKYANDFKLKIICNSNSYHFSVPDKLNTDMNTNPFLKIVYLGNMGLDENFLFLENFKYYSNSVNPYVTKTNHNIISWKIVNSDLSIKGYNCFEALPIVNTKANLGLSVMGLKVWFSNQFNLKCGPTRYGNLPGFIVALENKYVRFELDGIKETNRKIIKLDKFLGRKSIKTFEEAEEFQKNIGDMIRSKK